MAERSNAYCYETGGLRRVHVRRRDNVAKRVRIQAATYNLALLMRMLLGAGTPKGLAGRLAAASAALAALTRALGCLRRRLERLLVPRARLAEIGSGHAARLATT